MGFLDLLMRYVDNVDIFQCKNSLRYQRGNQNPYIEEEQHNDQKKKYKRTNNDLQNIHINLKVN